MKFNPNARTETVDVLFNPAELGAFDALCKAIGKAKSSFLRDLANQQVRTHGSPPGSPKEPGHCRVARPANRASVGLGMRRNF